MAGLDVVLFGPSGARLPLAPPPEPTIGAGRTRALASGAEIDWGQFREEYLSELRGPRRVRALEELLTDPSVVKEIQTLKLPLYTANVRIEAPEDPTPEEQDAADLCNANLLRTAAGKYGREFYTETPWLQRQHEILACLEYGFAVFLKERERVGDRIVFSRIRYLMPRTIERWYFTDLDQFVGIQQYARLAGSGRWYRQDIGAEDLAIYPWSVRGIVYEGVPLVRPMWKPFAIKRIVEKLEVINYQRQGAPPPTYEYGSDTPSQKEQDVADEILESFRQGVTERSYFKVPHGARLGFMTQSTAANAEPILRQKVMDIARVGGTQFTEAATQGTGSRAVAESQSGMTALITSAIAHYVAEMENSGVGPFPGVIEELVQMNFAKVKRLPRMVYGAVDKDAPTKQLPHVIAAKQNGAITWGATDEAELRQRLGWIARSDADDPDDEEDGDPRLARLARVSLDEVRDELRAFREAPEGAVVIDRAGRRTPMKFEKAFADIGSIDARLEQFKNQYLTRVQAVGAKIARDLGERIRSGQITGENADKVKLRFANELTQGLESILRRVVEFGRDQTAAMIQREAETLDIKAAKRIRLQSGVLQTARAADRVETFVRLDVKRIFDAMANSFLEDLRDAEAQGLTAEDAADRVEAELPSLTGQYFKALADMSGSSAFAEGQAITLIDQDQIVDFVVRSEILDDATCDTCERLDGLKLAVGSPMFYEKMPPNFCDGGHRCRGVMIPILKEAA